MLQSAKSSAWKVVAASTVAGQVVSSVLMGAHGRPPFAPEQLPVVIVVGLCAGAWGVAAFRWRCAAEGGSAGC